MCQKGLEVVEVSCDMIVERLQGATITILHSDLQSRVANLRAFLRLAKSGFLRA